MVPEERAAAGTDSAAPALPTVLVFRTQRVQTVADYVIVGDNLWDLSGPTPRKIPLASLDLDATARVNHDRGVEFRGPGSR